VPICSKTASCDSLEPDLFRKGVPGYRQRLEVAGIIVAAGSAYDEDPALTLSLV